MSTDSTVSLTKRRLVLAAFTLVSIFLLILFTPHVSAQSSIFDILKKYMITRLVSYLYPQVQSTYTHYPYYSPNYSYTPTTNTTLPYTYSSQLSNTASSSLMYSLPSVPYSNKQFILAALQVLQYPHWCNGTLILRVCLLHDSPYVLYDVKLSLGVTEGKVLAVSPSKILIVEPYSSVCLVTLLRTYTCGSHILSITLSWSKVYKAKIVMNGVVVPGEEVRTVPDHQTILSTLTVLPSPDFRISVSPQLLIIGKDNDLMVEVCNVGNGTAYDVHVSLMVVPEGVSLTMNRSQPVTLTMQSLKPRSCVRIPLLITVMSTSHTPYTYAQAGSVLVKVYVTYFEEKLGFRNITYTTYLGVLPSSPVQVLPETLVLNASSVNLVHLKVCNPNMFPIHNVTLNVLSTQSAILLNSTLIPIGDLPPRSCKLAKIVLAVPRVLSVPIVRVAYELTYWTGSLGYLTQSGTFTFQVLTTPRLIITQITVAPKVVKVGEAVVISVQISNVGTSPAYNVNVTIVPDMHLVAISTPYMFTSMLAPQSQTVASFTLNATRSGVSTCKIIVTYLDEYGRMHVLTRCVHVNVVSSTSTALSKMEMSRLSAAPMLAIAIACALPILGTVLYVIRKRA